MTTITVTVKVTGGTENDLGTLVDDIEVAVVASLMHQEPEDPGMSTDWKILRVNA
jgi:hypothetical protein